MSRVSLTLADGTTRSVPTGPYASYIVPGAITAEEVIRSDVVKSNRVSPTRYSAKATSQIVPRLTGWNEQTVHYNHSGPMMGSVLHLDTGIGTILRQRSIAANRAISNVKAQKVNLSMAFAQRKESLSLIKNTTLRIASGLKAIARKDWNDLRRALGESEKDFARRLESRKELHRLLKLRAKNVSSKHLAAVFGFAPLISDIQGAIDEVMSDPRSLEFVASGRSKVTGTKKATVGVPWRPWKYGNVPPPSYGPNKTTTTSAELSSRCFLRFRVEAKALNDMSRLGVWNQAYTAWDYLPWSFMIDWVVNIGQWLNSLDYDTGLSFVAGCYSERSVDTTTVEIDPYDLRVMQGSPPKEKHVVHATYTPGIARQVTFERWPISQPPSVTLVFKNPFRIFTVAATVALAAQMLNTKRELSPKRFSYKRPKTRRLKPISYMK